MSTETASLSELLEPVSACLTVDSARKLVALRASPASQAKLEALAEKSTAGTLTASERAEYQTLVSAGTFIAVLQSKARQLLRSYEAT